LKRPAKRTSNVNSFTRLSLDILRAVAQNFQQAGQASKHSQEAKMPAYEIRYLDEGGDLTYKFSATCDNDQRAKILAHAMKLPSMKRLQVWSGEDLIYARPSADQRPRSRDGVRPALQAG
jgi:hypothetical protein